MQCSFDRLTQLLGVSPNGKMFSSFVSYLDREFVVEETGKGESIIYLHKAGLIFVTLNQKVQCILFELNVSPSDKEHWCQYSGDLINGITATDTRADVKLKLSVDPSKSQTMLNGPGRAKLLMETYELRPLILDFTFDTSTGKIDGLSVTKVIKWKAE